MSSACYRIGFRMPTTKWNDWTPQHRPILVKLKWCGSIPFNKGRFVSISRTLKRLKSLPTSVAWWIRLEEQMIWWHSSSKKESTESFYHAYTNLEKQRPAHIYQNYNFQHQCSETWRMTTASTRQVQTFISKCLRRILRVYWSEVISKNLQETRKRDRPRTSWRRSMQKNLKEINMTWCKAKRAAQAHGKQLWTPYIPLGQRGLDDGVMVSGQIASVI